jgi:hypothetical protein
LWAFVAAWKDEIDPEWQHFLQAAEPVTLDHVVQILDQLRSALAQLDAKNRRLLSELPIVRRPYGSKSAEKFLTEYLSKRMRKTYGQPHDAIVAALTEVAFDVSKGLGTETVRGRRRKK